MAETLPVAAAAIGQIINSNSAARLSNEAKATLQNEQRGLTINRLTLNFQSCGAIPLFFAVIAFTRKLCWAKGRLLLFDRVPENERTCAQMLVHDVIISCICKALSCNDESRMSEHYIIHVPGSSKCCVVRSAKTAHHPAAPSV